VFADALRMLGKRYGVEVENEDPRAARVRSEKEAIYHANDVARAFFHRMLLDPREGAAALAYCTERGITSDIELIAMDKINEGYERMLKSDVKYRFVIDMATLKGK